MDKLYDVIVAGELNVDLILNNIKQFPEIGKEVLADDMILTLGSSSAIFASNLSIFGSKVTFVGNLGNDIFADIVIKSFENKNVHTGNLMYSATAKTGITVVMNVGEDRAMLTYPGAMAGMTAQHVSESVLQTSRHLHVSSIFLQPALKHGLIELMNRAKKNNLTTSLDTQWDPDEKWDLDLESLLPLIDVFLPNMQEFLALTASADLESGIETIKDFANTLVVKDGSNGAWLWEKGTLTHQPAFVNTEIVDCIGAGDSFDAGFIHGIITGCEMKECARIAALAGAINTTAAGGTTAFSNLKAACDTAELKFKAKFL
jgi:sugar/nucleoside kinase (ribokinase family)